MCSCSQALGGIHSRTVTRTKARVEATGKIEFDTSRKGRSRALPRDAIDRIVQVINLNATVDQKTIQEYTQQSGFTISTSTISRFLVPSTVKASHTNG
jgi:transposase